MHIEEILMKLSICLFLIKDDELLEKYNEIWGKVKSSIKKEFDSEPVYNEKSTQMSTIVKHQQKVSNYLFISNFDRFCF